MSQASLFTPSHTKDGMVERPTLRPIARHGDPAPSIAAADTLVASSAHNSQCWRVLNALDAIGVATSKHLARRMDEDRHRVARRLPDLLCVGWVEKVPHVVGETQWRVTALGQRALHLGLPMPRPAKARARGAA
jgi:hypothetical protein